MRFLFTVGLLLATAPVFAQSKTYPAAGVDQSADPCTDFYKYACGTWLANNPIPGDYASYGRFTELFERNQAILHDILDKAAAKPANDLDRKIGAFYGACMDEKGANERGIAAIQPVLDQINSIHDLPSLSIEVGKLQRAGVNAIFGVSSGQDFKDATIVTAQLDQGGLGLPEKDYYFKTDANSVELRQKYVEHIGKMFQLTGQTQEQATASAATVMRIETELAKVSMDITSRRDPANVYHFLTRDETIALAPAFDWKDFFPLVHADYPKMNVATPDFFKGMGALLNRLSFDDWKTYLTWHTVHASATMLSTKFLDENFSFYGSALTGQKEMRARWKRCVQRTDDSLGEALGQAYVDRTFGVQGKERTQKLVRDLENAMEQDIAAIEWMTPDTRKKAVEKLHAIANKIGYPDKWRDYSAVAVRADDPVGNVERATEFEFDRQMSKIGKPVDKSEWQMTPPTVNAYYDPQMNNINFPAGILQPPFFDVKLDDAVNYGAVGAVIGHEITHGFDDQGRQFDASGNFADWWKKEDATAFEERSKCIEDEYGSFSATADTKQNGKLTEGENIADNGGVRIAYAALSNILQGKKISRIDGYTPQQRFFLGYAQVWCTNATDKVRRLQAQSDPHSLPEFRVNGTVSNMPEFAAAFSCKVGTPMAPKKNCRVW